MTRSRTASTPAVPASPADRRQSDAAGAVLQSRRCGWLWRVVAVGGGLAAGFALAEVGLRVAGLGPPRLLTKRMLVDEDSQPRINYHCYPTNPHGEFEPTPDASRGNWRLMNVMLPPQRLPLGELAATPWCVSYAHSQFGLRDRDYDPWPAEGTLRIALVGDSFAFGEGVPLERTLFRRLETALSGTQVINAAKPGLYTAHELAALAQVQEAFHTARAIVVFTANDILPSPELSQRQNFINDLINIRDEYLNRHRRGRGVAVPSRVVELAGYWLDMRRLTRETIQWYLDCYDPRFNAENLLLLERQFRQFAAQPGCRVVFVLYPLMEGLEGAYPLAPIHRTVTQMLEAVGLPVFDLAPVFAGQPTRELWVHETDHHPNGRAHALAAEAIAAWLVSVPGFLDAAGEPRPPWPADGQAERQGAARP